jgi:hypothetical protein
MHSPGGPLLVKGGASGRSFKDPPLEHVDPKKEISAAAVSLA